MKRIAPPPAPSAGSGRLLSVDLAKSAAICAVLLIHCSANHYARFEIGSLSWLVTNFFGSVSRWAVPLFVLCSGAVMNDPDKAVSMKSLFSKYLLRLLLALTAWSVVYEAVDIYRAWGTAGLGELLTGAVRNLFYGNTHYHLYFCWLVFLLYLSLPLTRLIARCASEQELRYLVLFGLLCGAVLPFLQYYPPVNQMHRSVLYFVLPYSFCCPALGLAGWYFRTHPPKYWPAWLLLFLGSLGVTFGGVWSRSKASGVLDGVYLGGFSLFVILMAIAVFRLCQCLAVYAAPAARAAAFVSSASFCGYLVHPLFQEALAPERFLSGPVYFAVPAQWLMCMTLSLLTYLILRKLPGVRSWLI